MNAPVWKCEKCGDPLDPAANDGSIFMRYAEWHAYRKADAAWTEAHTNSAGWVVSDARDLADAPDLRWHVVHDACDDSAATDAGIYWIDVDRMDTWPKLASWSAHLHGKQWFADTDWPTLLYRAGVGAVAA